MVHPSVYLPLFIGEFVNQKSAKLLMSEQPYHHLLIKEDIQHDSTLLLTSYGSFTSSH